MTQEVEEIERGTLVWQESKEIDSLKRMRQDKPEDHPHHT